MTVVELSAVVMTSLPVFLALSDVFCVVFGSSLPLSSFSLESDEESSDPEVLVDLLFSFDVSVLSVAVKLSPRNIS